MKIDKWDKKILKNLYKNSRDSLSKLSKKVGLPKENIHYRIKRFEKENLINYIPYVNLSKMGIKYFLIRMRIDPLSKNYSKFIKDIIKDEKILWLSEDKIVRAKKFNLTAIMTYIDFSKIEDIFTKFTDKGIIEEFELALVRTFGFNYNDIYSDKEAFSCFMKAGAHRFENKTDKTDKKMVLKLLENSRISLKELGSKLRVSPLTVKSRIKKLIEKDVIKNFMISLNFNKLDGKFIALVYSAETMNVSKEVRKITGKYFSEVMTISAFFTKQRILFGRVKDEQNFLKAMSELNKFKGMIISSVSENTQILKNKIF
jgi:DNA-binding Lrp family transcriptional regulator